MNVRALLLFVLVLVVCAFAQDPAKTKPRFASHGIALRLTNQQKLMRAKLLNLKQPPVGISSSLELSVQKPFAENLGYLRFETPMSVNGGSNYVEGLPKRTDSGPYNVGFIVHVHLKILKPYVTHLLTIYVDSDPQDLDLNFDGESKKVHCPGGPAALVTYIVPTKPGDIQFQFKPTTQWLRFSRIEIDLMTG